SVPFDPDPDTRVEVIAVLRDADIRDKDIVFGPHRDPRALWTRIATLRHHVSRWDTSRRFARFHHDHRDEIAHIDSAYQALLAKPKGLFRRAEILEADREEPKVTELLRGIEEDFLREAGALEKRMYQLISRGVLQSTVTESARTAALERLGFRVDRVQIAG